MYNCKPTHMLVRKIEISLYYEKLFIWFSFKLYKKKLPKNRFCLK